MADTDDLLSSAYKQLKPVERMFVDAYLADLEHDAVAAGRRVVDFLAATHHQPRWANYYANRMMKMPLVKAAIAERIEGMTRAMELSGYKVLREVMHISMSSMAHYFEFDPVTGDPVMKLHKCTPEQLAAIASIEIEERPGGAKKTKIKLHDKLKGLDMLMRHMGLYADDNAQRQPVLPPGHVPAQITKQSTVAQAADLYAQTLRRV